VGPCADGAGLCKLLHRLDGGDRILRKIRVSVMFQVTTVCTSMGEGGVRAKEQGGLCGNGVGERVSQRFTLRRKSSVKTPHGSVRVPQKKQRIGTFCRNRCNMFGASKV